MTVQMFRLQLGLFLLTEVLCAEKQFSINVFFTKAYCIDMHLPLMKNPTNISWLSKNK